MDQLPAAPRNAPAENRFLPIVRAFGIGVLVLILWSVDKVAVRRIPQGSVWRYIVSGIIISVGLATVLSFTDRLSGEKS